MTVIHLRFDSSEPDIFVLDRPLEMQTSIGPIVVPQGFKTDLASTHFVWRSFPKFHKWTAPAIVHDFLYQTLPDNVDRWRADRVFYELLKREGVKYGIARIMYRTVREFGDSAWRGIREELVET